MPFRKAELQREGDGGGRHTGWGNKEKVNLASLRKGGREGCKEQGRLRIQ